MLVLIRKNTIFTVLVSVYSINQGTACVSIVSMEVDILELDSSCIFLIVEDCIVDIVMTCEIGMERYLVPIHDHFVWQRTVNTVHLQCAGISQVGEE